MVWERHSSRLCVLEVLLQPAVLTLIPRWHRKRSDDRSSVILLSILSYKCDQIKSTFLTQWLPLNECLSFCWGLIKLWKFIITLHLCLTDPSQPLTACVLHTTWQEHTVPHHKYLRSLWRGPLILMVWYGWVQVRQVFWWRFIYRPINSLQCLRKAYLTDGSKGQKVTKVIWYGTFLGNTL